MSGSVTADPPRRVRRSGFEETSFEREGLRIDAGAPVTGAAATGAFVAAGFGDGTVRFFRDKAPAVTVEAHRGAVLCLAADSEPGYLLTGGDDGRFLRLSPEGDVAEIASFGTRWVDCVAAHPKWRACSSGRIAQVWGVADSEPKPFEHPSTVGGLAFDTKGKRLAVAHYGGATVWERGDRRWKPKKLAWKGSHGAVSFSPDGKFVVTSMQENALHGWRLRDKADMRMSGYPAKVKSFAWTGDGPYLATSGADTAVCWPFEGRQGPMGSSPITCAYGGKQLCTAVAGGIGLPGVFAGFADGAVLAGSLAPEAEDLVVKGSSGSAVSALAISPEGWLLVGEESGSVLWVKLGGKGT